MFSSLVLIGTGLFVRTVSSIMRALFDSPFIDRFSLNIGFLGIWVALHGDGVWATIWPLLPLILLVWFLPERMLKQKLAAMAGDVLLVVLVGLTAIPRPEAIHLVGLIFGVALASVSIDYIVPKLPRFVSLSIPGLAVAAVLLLTLVTPATLMGGYRLLQSRLLVVGTASPFAQSNRPTEAATSPIQTINDINKMNEEVDGIEVIPTKSVEPAAIKPVVEGPDEGKLADEALVEPEETPEPKIAADGDSYLPVMTRSGSSLPDDLVIARPLDLTFANPTVSGNPFDLEVDVVFEHIQTGRSHKTQMFYMGGDEWRVRFTASAEGEWNYTTSSSDSDLNGLSGTVDIVREDGLSGFVSADGQKWVRTGETREAFVPQFYMYAEPVYFYNDTAKIEADIANFMGEHGFTGPHVKVLCRWFDLEEDSCNDINLSDPNPDLRTFEALEQLILEVYDQGGVVHIWAWGDESRGQTPQRWGYNQQVDQRLQRYIAARLGPLPGWTMGYGFDLFEWTNEEQLDTWYEYMHEHLGWHHMLGARSHKNQLNQISEMMDYSSYEQHRPDYAKYIESLDTRPEKPTFSEDRFRVRNQGRPKDYSLDDTRQGLWRSGMSGGVANIWGYLLDGGSDELGSATYPNKDEIKLYFDYFDPRYSGEMTRCNELTDGMCLKTASNQTYIFYIEDASQLFVDLSEMDGEQPYFYMNTKTGYSQTGIVSPGRLDISFFVDDDGPVIGDWAVFVGD